jgi:hypothetical protein
MLILSYAILCLIAMLWKLTHIYAEKLSRKRARDQKKSQKLSVLAFPVAPVALPSTTTPS